MAITLQLCSDSIVYLFGAYGRRTGLGYVLSNDSAVQTERGPDTIRGADVCYYTSTRWPHDQVGRKVPPVPPDVVIEVYSPSNRPGEMRTKVNEYLAAGVPLVLVVRPDHRTVALWRPVDVEPIVL